MTQEEKQLVLQDICGRLPYGIIVQYKQKTFSPDDEYTVDIKIDIDNMLHHRLKLLDFKPYLRPMSSMTEKEKEELISKCIHTETEEDWEGMRSDVWGIKILGKYDTRRWDNTIWVSTINMDAIDWLNAHHFDYRGLIPMGLAIEAPEGIYGENC